MDASIWYACKIETSLFVSCLFLASSKHPRSMQTRQNSLIIVAYFINIVSIYLLNKTSERIVADPN